MIYHTHRYGSNFDSNYQYDFDDSSWDYTMNYLKNNKEIMWAHYFDSDDGKLVGSYKRFTYFGQDCEYFIGQFEPDDGDKIDPVLVYCNHRSNEEDVEGNCNPNLCPLHKMYKDFGIGESI